MKKRDSQLLNSKYFKKGLVLKGFETVTDYDGGHYNEYDAKNLIGYFFEDEPAQKQFEKFQDLIFSKIGKEFFPIYRMADGEFKLIEHLFLLKISKLKAYKRILKNVKIFLTPYSMYGRKLSHDYKSELLSMFDPYYFRVAHGESFNKTKLQSLQILYPKLLKQIAQKGKLAIHFMEEKGNTGYANYHEKVLGFFEKIGLELNKDNYTHFYFIYALLNGSGFKKIYENKNILIVTHYSKDKKIKIINTLKEYGVSHVNFLKISEKNSMYDVLDREHLEKLKGKIDLVLVGAGLGSCNILLQLEPLQTVCIDAGINIECLANPSLRKKRIFLSLYNISD